MLNPARGDPIAGGADQRDVVCGDGGDRSNCTQADCCIQAATCNTWDLATNGFLGGGYNCSAQDGVKRYLRKLTSLTPSYDGDAPCTGSGADRPGINCKLEDCCEQVATCASYDALRTYDSTNYPGVLNETAFNCRAQDLILNTPAGVRRYETKQSNASAG